MQVKWRMIQVFCHEGNSRPRVKLWLNLFLPNEDVETGFLSFSSLNWMNVIQLIPSIAIFSYLACSVGQNTVTTLRSLYFAHRNATSKQKKRRQN